MQNEGHIQPSLRSAYDFLSKGFPQGKAPVDTWLELVVHRSALGFAKFVQLAPSFRSHYIDDSLGGFYFYFVSHI